MTDNMVDNVFVSILGLNFPLLAETSLFCLAHIFSLFVLARFFSNVKCLLDIFLDSTPPPHQKSNGPSLTRL